MSQLGNPEGCVLFSVPFLRKGKKRKTILCKDKVLTNVEKLL